MLTLIALFGICIITFAVNFGYENNANVNIADDDYDDINVSLQSDVESFYQGVNTSAEAYAKSTISTQTESSEGGTQFKATPTTSLSMGKRTLTAAWNKIFGQGGEFGIVFTALISILGFVMFMLAWKAWAGRNPE